MAEVRLKIGAYIEGLKKGINQAKGHIARFTNYVKTHNAQIRGLRMKAGLALAGEILIARDLIKTYRRQEEADQALAQAMKNRGVYTEQLMKQYKEYAASLQKVTIYGDEEIEYVQGLMLSLGRLEGEALKKATEATLDLATAQKMDIRAAANLMAKSIGSTTNALSRYGIVMKEGLIDPSERAEDLIQRVTTMFGGQAKAAAQGAGKLAQLGNVVGDLKEKLGEALVPILVDVANKLMEVIPKIGKFIQENRKLVAILIGGGIGGTGLILALSQLALIFANPATGWIAGIGFAALAVASLVVWMDKLISSVREVPDSIEGLNKAIDEAEKKLERYRGELEMLKKTEPVAGENIVGDIKAVDNAITRQLAYLVELETARAKLIGARRETMPPLFPVEQLDEAGLNAQIETLRNFIDRVTNERERLVAKARPIQLLPEIERTPEQIAQLDKLAIQITEKTALINEATDALKRTMQITFEAPKFEGESYGDAFARALGIDEESREKYLTWLQEQQEEVLESQEGFYDTYIDLAVQAQERREEAERQHLANLHYMTERAMKAHVDIWQQAFSDMFNFTRTGMQNIGLAMLEGFVGLLKMQIDKAVNAIIAESIEVKGKVLLRSLLNPAELGKLALIGAIVGTVKSGLNALVSAARGDMAASVPRYQYGGIVPETGLAVVHAGERIFNPEHPVESLRNVGGALNFNQTIYGNIDRDDLDRANEDFVDYLFSRRLARGLD
jgi:archaellum component FlaC